MNDLQITVQTQSGSLTVTPLSLLQFYLPGAQPLPDNPQIYAAPKPGKQGEMQYLFVETMMGALQTCKEKHLNPVSEIYIIPSNSPTKKSGFKIKYDAALERIRKVPGFLGVNWGLIVQHGKEIIDRAGEAKFPGDTIVGAWSECYIAGLVKPVRHEVDLSVKGVGPNWDQRFNFMLCKVAVDRLVRLKVIPIYGKPDKEDDEVLLEAKVPEVAPPSPPAQRSGPNAAPPQQKKTEREHQWNAGEMYIGKIVKIMLPIGKTPGSLTLKPDSIDGELTCFFRETPQELLPYLMPSANEGEVLLNEQITVGVSFRIVSDEQRGRKYRVVDTIDCCYPTDDESEALIAAFAADREGRQPTPPEAA